MEGREAAGAGPGGSMQVPYGIMQPRSAGMGTPPGGGMGATGSPQGLHAPAATRPVTSISGMTLGTTSPSMESGPSGAVPGMTMPPGTGMSGSMSGGPLGGSEPVKRKRGRPRKYTGTDAEGNIIPLATPLSGSSPLVAGSPSTPSERRSRGRPPGSGKKQQLAALGVVLAGSAGQGFTPHIITIAAGEDVASRIMSFVQHGPRAVCVMSATGAISNVTLRQQSSSGGTVTYEGRYEILSLSGSYLLQDTGGGARQRTGGLSVSLAATDGRVIGGSVAGLLVAASPIQVVVGTFISDPGKSISKPRVEQEAFVGLSPASGSGVATSSGTPRPPKLPTPGGYQGVGASAPSSQSGGQTSPSMGMYQSMGAWTSSQPSAEVQRADINALPGG
ncbi:hypothetical protein BDL97_17G062900 [Sphagnum fallax]|nr:hypothetical protein BDL97_17G062900 [Sphagnum fallax]KAH8936044.1 hypothetical protein BDL97_17G062900 [Sphagnum fallax]KAH8936045.1 hypothetical protein BDL97_17G062900 [Sphagnum fallax]KAH8936046.1 hypothetical protein BDL97_17G062900 [Sphagnum fallax]KAH8936047.1 hypothetical protein BDL97_17G062900 [Sphagnum fallax]